MFSSLSRYVLVAHVQCSTHAFNHYFRYVLAWTSSINKHIRKFLELSCLDILHLSPSPPPLKSQMYYPTPRMKMDGTENDWGCEITKTGVIWERGIWLHYPRVLRGTESCSNILHLSLSLALLKTVNTFVESLRKQLIEVLVDFGLGVAVLTVKGSH